MKPSKPTLKAYYPGLNVFRALAVLMMILAHAARIQTNMGTLHSNPSQAGLFDWPFVAMLLIEPIISATFLFIAGFSLVLSIAKGKTQAAWQGQSWLTNLGKKMLVLYLISVIFYVADQGLQTPDFLVSSGVLAIIAVGVFLSGLLLVSPKPTVALIIALLCTLLCAYFLEQQKWNIVGLNAGAGGIVPLASMAFAGALAGLIWQRWNNNGLWILLAASSVIALLALLQPHPWIVFPRSSITQYPGNRIDTVWFSILDFVGLYQGQSATAIVRYWNHTWIFPMRVLPLLVIGLMVSLNTFKKPLANPIARYANWLGTQALNLYILHLVLLALVEVSGLHSTAGWQTTLILIGVIALSSWLLRYVSFVPLKITLRATTKAHKN